MKCSFINSLTFFWEGQKKRFLRKFYLRKYMYRNPSKYVELIKDNFYHIGDDVELFTSDFGAEPYLISIEDKVRVAVGVKFINHDISCFRVADYLGIENSKVDKVGSIVLHKNCYVGAYSILLPNSSVGENSVIAAGSVVTKHIPPNEVWGGVPAKFIMSLDDYAQKVVENSLKYPWMENKERMSKQELIIARQNFFFCKGYT